MAGRRYVGRYRRRRGIPFRDHYRLIGRLSVALAMTAAGTIAVVGVDLGARAAGPTQTRTRPSTASPATTARPSTRPATTARPSTRPATTAQPSTASPTTKTRPSTPITTDSADVTLGKLTLHFDTTEATTVAIPGDDLIKRVSWKVRVSNNSGTTVSIGDPTTIVWTTDGSGHVAVTRQSVVPGSQQAVVISFELPEVLEPSSITLALGSSRADVRVKSG